MVPCGARISAGKFGMVDRSLPKAAASEVNLSPVSCIPSPESPANRMTTRSSLLISVWRGGGNEPLPFALVLMGQGIPLSRLAALLPALRPEPGACRVRRCRFDHHAPLEVSL